MRCLRLWHGFKLLPKHHSYYRNSFALQINNEGLFLRALIQSKAMKRQHEKKAIWIAACIKTANVPEVKWNDTYLYTYRFMLELWLSFCVMKDATPAQQLRWEQSNGILLIKWRMLPQFSLNNIIFVTREDYVTLFFAFLSCNGIRFGGRVWITSS